MESNTMNQRALAAARPWLADRRIERIVVGLNIIGVMLDDGEIGTSYVLREELEGCICLFRDNLSLLGRPAEELAAWAASERHVLKRAIGIAVLNATARRYLTKKGLTHNADFFEAVRPHDRVAMVGYIGPVVRKLQASDHALRVFDRGHAGYRDVEPQENLEEALGEADVVFLSGTAFINGSMESLLACCTQAREVIVIGSTTLAFTEVYRGTPVTRVAGTLWDRSQADRFFDSIALMGGIPSLRFCMGKFCWNNPPETGCQKAGDSV